MRPPVGLVEVVSAFREPNLTVNDPGRAVRGPEGPLTSFGAAVRRVGGSQIPRSTVDGFAGSIRTEIIAPGATRPSWAFATSCRTVAG